MYLREKIGMTKHLLFSVGEWLCVDGYKETKAALKGRYAVSEQRDEWGSSSYLHG